MSSSLVLISGGLDSAVLVADEARHHVVHPVYVSTGLAWEPAERRMLERLLATPPFLDNVRPLTSVAFAMDDVYGAAHWAVAGRPPAYDTPDEDVYLAGRNLVLLTKAGVVAAARGVPRIAIGPLAGNPFPDATPAFFEAMGRALSRGLDTPIEIVAPFLALTKREVIGRGRALGVDLSLTLSCMNPTLTGELPEPCGACSKCRERADAFA